MSSKEPNEGRMSGWEASEAEGGRKNQVQGPTGSWQPTSESRKETPSTGQQPLPGPRIWPADYGLPIRSPCPLSQALCGDAQPYKASSRDRCLGLRGTAGRLVQLDRRETRTERKVSSNLNLKRLVIYNKNPFVM